MTDLDFICALMRTETDALGFIPRPTLYDRITRHGRYLIQTDSHGRKLGYLLHGPTMPDRTIKVYQAVVDIDHRRIQHATRLVDRLIRRARAMEATSITLRCALDLEANAFWIASGFHLEAILPGGARRNRLIATYRLQVASTAIALPTPQTYQNR